MARFFVDDIQAVEADSLPEQYGITVTISPTPDGMGLPRVKVESDNREALVSYIRSEWGDEDSDWFQQYILDRIIDTKEGPNMDSYIEAARQLNENLPDSLPLTDDIKTVEDADEVLAVMEAHATALRDSKVVKAKREFLVHLNIQIPIDKADSTVGIDDVEHDIEGAVAGLARTPLLQSADIEIALAEEI